MVKVEKKEEIKISISKGNFYLNGKIGENYNLTYKDPFSVHLLYSINTLSKKDLEDLEEIINTILLEI